MRLQLLHRSALILVLNVLLASAGLAASGTIEGRVRDSQTGDALPGANVQIVKTGLGSSTDLEGRYAIREVTPGTYTLRATYVGYKQKEITVQVGEGQTLKQDFKLVAVGVEGEEVVVTAQAQGQKEAINQQISALPIMNIVSRARIQELPDANAAESVSRLPGVSLIRTGGEGSKVVIRGLSPQYNQITVEGVELPSNVTSQNVLAANGGLEATGNAIGDRGEDLSMISSSMLNGIEVIKAITPDMDAAVLGGVVNFGLRKAQKTSLAPGATDMPLAPMVELRMQGGYNRLKTNYDNYKWVASVEKRFFENQSFGVFVQGSDEKRNLSSNNMSAGYSLSTKLPPPMSDVPLPQITGVGISDTFRKRQRMGGTVVLDFQHERGEIGLLNFYSDQKTQEITRSESYSPGNNGVNYSAGESNNEMKVMSNLLSIKHDFSLFRVDLKVSHSYTESSNPEDLSFSMPQPGSNTGLVGNLTWVDPKMVASQIVHNQAVAWLDGIGTSSAISHERTVQASLDLTKDIALSLDLTSRIKIGGTFQHRTRDFDFGSAGGSQTYSGGGAVVTAIQQAFPWLQMYGGRISMMNFTKDSYQYGEFLNGDFQMGYPINVNLMWAMLPVAKKTPSLEGYQTNKTGSVINDYNGWENKSAGYAMVSLDYGPTLSIIPGVRYQDLTTRYTAMRILQTTNSYQGGPATIQHSHGYYLPMLHARYRMFEWLQFHFAYTQTLNYPDYSILTPRYIVSPGAADYNNHAITPAKSENLDLVVAFISNEIGLLSFNGFKKKIKDLVFFTHTYTADLSKWPELPQGGSQLYGLNTYINSPIPIDLYGLETEWQTHFWYLPKPFDGLVLNLNYTHIFSEASYPRTIINTDYDDEGNMTQTVTDTFYTSRMLNQPNDIMNLAVGYDLAGFSLRLSMLYTDNIFKNPDFWLQQRVLSDKFVRWDLSVKQDLPWFGMQVFFNVNNITGEDDVDLNQKNRFRASQQRYGMSADLGFVVHL
jgi:TonB-dependent receptor